MLSHCNNRASTKIFQISKNLWQKLDFLMNSRNQLTKNHQKIHIAKIVSVFLVAITFLFTTACISNNAMATSPQVQTNQISLLSTGTLLATNNNETTYSNNEGLLYSKTDKLKSLDNVNDFVSPQTQKKLFDATQIPAEKQPIVDRSNRNSKILEKTAQMFKDAGDFLDN